MIAKRLCDAGKVSLDSKPLKPSHELVGGEIIHVLLPQKELKLKVLELPSGKSVSKKERHHFFEIQSALEL